MIDRHARDVDRDERAVMLALWSACHMARECGWSLAEVLRALMMAWSRATDRVLCEIHPLHRLPCPWCARMSTPEVRRGDKEKADA